MRVPRGGLRAPSPEDPAYGTCRVPAHRDAGGELTHYRGRFQYQTASGLPGWYELSADAVDGPNGVPEHLLAYLRDDTGQH